MYTEKPTTDTTVSNQYKHNYLACFNPQLELSAPSLEIALFLILTLFMWDSNFKILLFDLYIFWYLTL